MQVLKWLAMRVVPTEDSAVAALWALGPARVAEVLAVQSVAFRPERHSAPSAADDSLVQRQPYTVMSHPSCSLASAPAPALA